MEGAYALACDEFEKLHIQFKQFKKTGKLDGKSDLSELSSLSGLTHHRPIVELLAAIARLKEHEFPSADGNEVAGPRSSTAGRSAAEPPSDADVKAANEALANRVKATLKTLWFDPKPPSFEQKWFEKKPRGGGTAAPLAWRLGLQLPSDVALDELAQRLESTYLTDESIAQVHKPSLRVVKFLRHLADFRARLSSERTRVRSP